MILPVLLNTSIFILLSFMHIYWALGGKRGMNAVIPTITENQDIIKPGPFITLAIAAGMGLFAFVIIGNLDIFPITLRRIPCGNIFRSQTFERKIRFKKM